MDKRPLIAHMNKVLTEAQKERPKRRGLVPLDTPWGHLDRVPAWNVFELETMWKEVNRFRKDSGLEPVTLLDVQKVEALACGHSDYSPKFALYCAELTYKDAPEVEA